MARSTTSEINYQESYTVINLVYMYGGSSFKGIEKYALISALSEDELVLRFGQELECYRPFTVISPDMYEVMREHYRNDDRERKRGTLYHDPFALDIAEILLVDDLSSPESICESNFIMEYIIGQMLALPEKQGSWLYMKYIIGLTVEEIASKEGVHKDIVYRSLREARKAIRDAFVEMEVVS